MKMEEVLVLLRREWDAETGFLGGVRYRQFNQEHLERLINTLRATNIENQPCLDRKLVALLWFMPLFLEWQKQSYEETDIQYEKLDTAINRIVNELYRILGIP